MTVCPGFERNRKSTPHVSFVFAPIPTVTVTHPGPAPFVTWERNSDASAGFRTPLAGLFILPAFRSLHTSRAMDLPEWSLDLKPSSWPTEFTLQRNSDLSIRSDFHAERFPGVAGFTRRTLTAIRSSGCAFEN